LSLIISSKCLKGSVKVKFLLDNRFFTCAKIRGGSLNHPVHRSISTNYQADQQYINHGPFQQLFPPGTNPDLPGFNMLSTEYGPGNAGYVGGRWWVDIDGNGETDEGVDHFFSCPLLGPGRTEP
jgi:hypothetical protein